MSKSVSCSICMSNYDEKEGDEFVSINCGHAYHRSCLLEWKASSKRTECPECRAKYTVRTLKKLFLHSELNKDDDDHFLEMQEEKERNVKLKSENDLVRAEKRKLEHDLLQTHNEYQNLHQKQIKLSQELDVKCKEHDITSLVNEEYVKVNEQMRRDYSILLKQNEKLIKENADLKLQQLKVSKPFVDLTGDDSDVEIVEEKKPEVKVQETPKTPEIIHIEESNESGTKQEDQFTTKHPYLSDFKNSDVYESYEDFEKFILDQI